MCVEILSRSSSGFPQMAQAKAMYTRVEVTHETPWPCGSTQRYCGPCRVFEQFDDVNTLMQDRNPGATTRNEPATLLERKASRRSPSATSYHTPGCRRPFSAGNRCLRSAGSAATDATPGRLKSTIQDSPGAHRRQCLRGIGWRRPGAAATPPRGPPRS